ncbi:Probable calcium-binding protein CML26 [Linum grandiflorum]
MDCGRTVSSTWRSSRNFSVRSPKEEEELREAFDLYDENKDGLVPEAEIHHVLNHIEMRCSVEEYARMIKGADSDGDGQRRIQGVARPRCGSGQFWSRLVNSCVYLRSFRVRLGTYLDTARCYVVSTQYSIHINHNFGLVFAFTTTWLEKKCRWHFYL